MPTGLSRSQASPFVLDLEREHTIAALIARFPWLGDIPDVRDLFRLMMRSFGDRLTTARTAACKAATEALSATEMQQLLSAFATRCPVDVTEWDDELGRRWSRNLSTLHRCALASIRHPTKPKETAEARYELLLVFCQLLLAIGLSPTAP